MAVPLMVLLGAAAGTVGLALYVKMTPADRVRPIEPPRLETPPVEPPKVQSRGAQVLIPIAHREGEALSFGQESYFARPGSDPRIEAVNAFLRHSQILPPEAKLLTIEVRDGEAQLNFTAEFERGQGSFDEATLIQGLRAVLGQFPEIRTFVLFADGQELRELGHFELGDPITTLPVSRWHDPEGSDEAPPPSMPR